MLHVSKVPRSSAVSAHTTCVLRPSPTEPCSGPPLPTKTGPAKWTTPRHGLDCLVWVVHPSPAYRSLYPPAPAHQVLSHAALCCVRSGDSAGLYSEGACYNVMIEALNSELNLFFNKLSNVFYKNVNALVVANSFGFILNLITLMLKLRFTRNSLTATM